MYSIKDESNVDARVKEEYWLKKALKFNHNYKLFDFKIDQSNSNNEVINEERLLKKEVCDQLFYLANNDNKNVLTFLTSVLVIVLHKYIQKDRFLIFTSPLQKDDNGIEQPESPVYVGVDLSSGRSFKELFLSMREELINSFRFQDYDHEEFLNKIEFRSLEGINIPVGINYSEIQNQRALGSENFVIDVDLCKESGTLTVKGMYYNNTFQKHWIDQILDTYSECLEFVIYNPNLNLTEYPYLSKNQISFMSELHYRQNNTQDSIISIFNQQVLNNPDGVVYSYADHCITYRQLNELSDQIAYYLKDQNNVKVNDLVAISLESQASLVASIIAVLKLGAGYVPIDVNAPSKRKKEIVFDSNVKSVITDSDFMFDFDATNVDFLIMDIQLDEIRSLPIGLEDKSAHSKVMYVVYTSGSTGEPKGVMVEKSAFLNQLHGEIERLKMNSRDRILNVFSIGFDVYHFQLFLSLLSGGVNVEVKESNRAHSALFVNEINAQRISRALFTGSYLDDLPLEKLNPLKTIIVGGEIASPFNISYLLEQNVRVLNYYGLTETACNALVCDLNLINSKDMPVGKPVANTHVYVVDENDNPLPFGVKGEIAVSGESLATGYLNDQENTAKKFTGLSQSIKKYQSSHSYKYFKTGDLGYFLPDGNIVFAGRKDRQVKYNGYRIELSEVERAIKKHKDVQNVAVVFHSFENEESILIAYVQSLKTLTNHDLFVFLSAILPHYMVPPKFIFIEKIPLNDNGKVDFKRLPPPKVFESDEKKLPSNKVEQKLMGIWQQVLMKKNIWVNSNFFELGGDSLKAIKIINLIEKEIGVTLELKDIFEQISIERIAVKIEESPVEVDEQNIQAVEDQEYYPVSHSQNQMWVLSQTPEGNKAYIVYENFNLPSQISYEKLNASFLMVIKKQESLRTTFRSLNGKPKQIILDPEETSFNMDFYDLSIEKDKSIKMQQIYDQLKSRTFDLENEILIRGTLVKLNEEEYQLLIAVHHLICDGWGIEILFKEIKEVYITLYAKREIQLKKLPINYKDYVIWQKRKLEQSRGHLDFWKNKIGEDHQSFQLPTDFERPPIKTYKGSRESIIIENAGSKRLEEFVSQYQVSPFVLLVASIKTLIYKITDQKDITIGTPVANRDHKDLENIVGLLMNVIPLKSNIDPERSFEDYLILLKEEIFLAYEHQMYPFELLTEKLNLLRDLSRSPIFDILIRLQNINEKQEEDASDNLKIQVEKLNKQTRYDLMFSFNYTEKNLKLTIEYNTDLFEQQTIGRFLAYYDNLLNMLLINPNKCLKEYSLLGQQKMDSLLSFVHGEKKVLPAYNIVDLFNDNVCNNPDSIAVVNKDSSYTYGSINSMCNQLAEKLLEETELHSNDIIAIALKPSENLIVSILTVLKLGLTYLPIDLSYPNDRIEYMLKDSNAKRLLSDQNLSVDYTPPLRVDEVLSKEAGRCTDKEITSLTDYKDHNAYVMYTSGSTGQPKGVVVTHENLHSYIDWANTYYFNNLNTADFALCNSISFDVSINPIFTSLTRGAKVVITDNSQMDRALLEVFYYRNNIKAAILTPSQVNILSDLALDSTHIEMVILGGETVYQTHLSILQRLNKSIKIFNAYGPTEITSACAFEELSSNEDITIGIPIQNASIYIMNSHWHIQPVGVRGQLCIGGAGVSKGYLNKVELTHQKFIQDPHNGNQRLYLSGDFGSWRSDGKIIFQGRYDDQIKWNGHRIELEEVKKVFLNIDGVKDAFIEIVKHNETKFFIAYLVIEHVSRPLRYYRTQAMNFLPVNMVPNHIMILNRMPLTSNGKVNKNKLPIPVLEEVNCQPKTKRELKLSELWSEVINTGEITDFTLDDNFFSKGGNSIKAIQLVSRINEQVGVNIGYNEVFQNPTIREQSELLEIKEKSAVECQERIEEQEYYKLTPWQYRFWVLHNIEKDKYKHKLLISFTVEDLDLNRFQKAVSFLFSNHESLRTIIFELNGEPRQKFVDRNQFDLPVYFSDPSDKTVGEKEFSQKFDTLEFNLTGNPLIQLHVVKKSDNQHLILVALHHIISDGASLEIIKNDLLKFYNHDKSHNNSQPIFQFKDYLIWLNKKTNKELLTEAQNYWIQKLSEANWNPRLPKENFKEVKVNYSSKNIIVQGISLEKEIKGKLLSYAHDKKGSLFMVILALIKSTLYVHTKEQDLLVGTPVSCRHNSRLERLIGNFLNTLVLRTQIKPTAKFSSVCNDVISTTSEAYKYNMLPLETLLKSINSNVQTDETSLFKIWVVMQNYNEFESTAKNSDEKLKITSGIQNLVAKYDLRFNINEFKESCRINIQYSSHLFSDQTIDKILRTIKQLASDIANGEDIVLNEVNKMEKTETDKLKIPQITKRRSRKNVIQQQNSFQTKFLDNMPELPLVISSNSNDVTNIMVNNREKINELIKKHGAILFRGFSVQNRDQFYSLVNRYDGDLLNYDFMSTPRSELGSKIYTSTEYPANQEIVMHNEMSYTKNYPEKLWFLCEQVAEEGGETTLANNERITYDLEDEIIKLFKDKKLLYTRNFREGLGLNWKRAFNTTDKEEVNDYCKKNDITYEWLGEDYLRTYELREAFIKHPSENKLYWFNQAHLFHSSNLQPEVRKALSNSFSEIEMPRNCFFGDRSEISDLILDKVRSSYEPHVIGLKWQPGDVLLLDNIKVCHGRRRYKGSRKIIVAMT